jgi:HD-like signal output (HDOD) protein
MDFDLSERLGSTNKTVTSQLTGTPHYMAPEHFASGRLDYRTDLYALGTILFEMLTAKTAVAGTTPADIVFNIVNNPMQLDLLGAKNTPPDVIDFVSRATAKDPAERFATAEAMRQALAACRRSGDDNTATHCDATVFVLRRMKRRQDFPAVSKTLIEINRLTAEDSHASSEDLARVILRDFALTNKLLRLANSSFYAVRSGQIKSVSDAVRILGLKQIRNATNSLLYLNQFNGNARSQEVIDLQIAGFLTGLLARHLAVQLKLEMAEEAFLCGVFHNLGPSLIAYYLPDEYLEILERRKSDPRNEAHIVTDVLGVGYDTLATVVAKEWGFPDLIVATLPSLPDGPIHKPESIGEALHQVTACAYQLANIVDNAGPPDAVVALEQLVQRFEALANLSPEKAEQLLQAGVQKLAEFAPLLDVVLARSPFHQRLTAWLTAAGAAMVSSV